MIVFDFIYFCIYSLVPDEHPLKKRNVACILFVISTGLLLEGLFLICAKLCNFKFHNGFNLLLFMILLFGSVTILTRMIFLKPEKFRSMHRRFRKIPKWLLKMIGIMYYVFCFVVFAFILIKLSMIKNT